MQLISSHTILVSAPSIEKGWAQVQEFFQNSMLVRYDKIDINREQCHGGNSLEFQSTLKTGIEANRNILRGFIEEFGQTGFQTIHDLIEVENGYPSKLLHIITHFLDGFIGIDTVFYNLIEDSHWISAETAEAIKAAPDTHWLIHLNCYSETPDKVAIVQQ